MGDPRKVRKKFSKPRHPWQKERIDAEKEIKKEYGIRRKDEIWKMNSMLKNFHDVAKKVVAQSAKGVGEKQRDQLLTRLFRLGILKQRETTTDAILTLALKDVMERRLQTLVFRKRLSHTPLQARQFITHGHISVGGRKVTAPSYIVAKDEEATICFSESSSIAAEDHPERAVKPVPVPVPEAEKETETPTPVTETKKATKAVTP